LASKGKDTSNEDWILSISNDTTALQANFTDFKTDKQDCFKALNQHKIGMLCVACSTNWSDYITVSGSEISVNVNTDTCTAA